MDDLVWSKNNVVVLPYECETDTIKSTIFLAFRYAQGFPLQTMKVGFEMKSPDGEVIDIPVTFDVKTSTGEYLGDGSGDIWDLEIPIQKDFKPIKGTYQFSIKQTSQIEKVPMVMEVGLVIK